MLISVSEIKEIVRHEISANAHIKTDPFPYAVLDDVLPVEFVHGLSREIDGIRSWFRYESPLEKKSTTNKWDEFGPYLYSYFMAMLSADVANEIADAFLIGDLMPDIGLHGGGVHASSNGDKLNVHQDYSIHPKIGLERRINVIFHVEPMWQKDFGGHLQFWSGGDQPEEHRVTVTSVFNRMVIFATSPGSWHGFPEPINGVDSIRRKSLATYYVSDLSDDAVERYRARYAPTVEQENDEFVLRLIRERVSRDGH